MSKNKVKGTRRKLYEVEEVEKKKPRQYESPQQQLSDGNQGKQTHSRRGNRSVDRHNNAQPTVNSKMNTRNSRYKEGANTVEDNRNKHDVKDKNSNQCSRSKAKVVDLSVDKAKATAMDQINISVEGGNMDDFHSEDEVELNPPDHEFDDEIYDGSGHERTDNSSMVTSDADPLDIT